MGFQGRSPWLYLGTFRKGSPGRPCGAIPQANEGAGQKAGRTLKRSTAGAREELAAAVRDDFFGVALDLIYYTEDPGDLDVERH